MIFATATRRAVFGPSVIFLKAEEAQCSQEAGQRSAERRLFPRLAAHAMERLVQDVRALAQALAFFVRHSRLEHLGNTAILALVRN
jgi:hypothetical protein